MLVDIGVVGCSSLQFLLKKGLEPAKGRPEFSGFSTSKIHTGDLAVIKLISEWLFKGLLEDKDKLKQLVVY